MQKPASLRAAIVASLPMLAQTPDRLEIWVDEGRVLSPMVESRAFGWSYRLTLVVKDFTTHPSTLFLAINDWLRVNQPDLLVPGQQAGYTFEVDILDDKTVDILLQMALTEQVVLAPREDGGFDLQHLAEPDPLFPETVALSTPPALLREIWREGERIVPLALPD